MASSPPMLPHDDEADALDDDDMMRDVDDLDEEVEEAEGIDLFADDFENDYRARENDAYEGEGIDDEGDYEGLDLAQRRELDRRLNRRDQEARRRMPAAFLPDEDEQDGLANLMGRRRVRRHRYDEEDDMEMGDDIMDEELSLEALTDVKANTLTDWIAQPRVAKTIYREFKSFLTEYTDEHGTSVYGTRIKTLGEVNTESLEVSFDHLAEQKATLAFWLANTPTEMLRIFDQVAMEVVLIHYPEYERIHAEIHVRITDVPVQYTLRQLRQTHLNSLVRVSGVVTRRSGVFPQLKYVKFDCTKCGVTLGPFHQDSNVEVKISFCQNCQSRGPFTVNSERTVYRNYQKLTLQESPGTVPAGRLPRHREVILLWDLIDSAKPGEEIEVTGIYRNNYDAALNNKNGFPVFATILEANYVVSQRRTSARFDSSQKILRS
jgi:DNA replication licensing factor MCM2